MYEQIMGNCQVCGGADMHKLLDMGDQPLAEQYASQPVHIRTMPKRFPLKLIQCGRCSLVQLHGSVDQRMVFPLNHPYSTGNSATLRSHFANLADDVIERQQLQPNDLVIDIGANDGTLLSFFDPQFRRVAVEPTNQAVKAAEKDITVYQEFFDSSTAKFIAGQYGNRNAKVILATNVLAHVPDPHDFLRGIRLLLHPHGVFVTENHDVNSILSGLQIDTIYHEHLRYFSVESLGYLLAYHHLSISEVTNIPTHGGSFRVYAKMQETQDFKDRVGLHIKKLQDLLIRIGVPVYGISATTRATPLIHFAQISSHIQCVCEVPGSEKIGLTIPGTLIPIVDEQKLIDDQPLYALLFAWHMQDFIIPKLRKAGYKGRVIVPLPEVRVYE